MGGWGGVWNAAAETFPTDPFQDRFTFFNVGATLPSTLLPSGLSFRVEDRTVSLCFGKAQHDEPVESSNRVVARVGQEGTPAFGGDFTKLNNPFPYDITTNQGRHIGLPLHRFVVRPFRVA